MNLRNSVLFSLPFVFFACGEPDNQPDLTWHGNNELKKAFDAFVDLGKKSGIAIPKEAEDYIKILESALDDKFEDLKVFAPSKNLDLWYFSTILNLSLFLKKMGKICLETVNNAKNQYIEDLKESKKIENEIFLCVREIKNSSFSLKPVCWEDLTLTLEDLGELYRKMKAGELNNSELLQISFLRHKFVFKIIDSQSESFLTIWRSGGLFLSPIFEEDFVSKHQEKSEFGVFLGEVVAKLRRQGETFCFFVNRRYESFGKKLVDGITAANDFSGLGSDVYFDDENVRWMFLYKTKS